MRIIHVVENLDKGAVENWLVNVFLKSRELRPEWEFTFYCILGKKGRLDDKVLAAGGKIIYSPFWISDKLKFLAALRRTLQQGNYDIIHSHHDYLSGFYLLASAGIHIKKRILHIHNTDKILPIGNARIQKLLLKPFQRLAIHYSDSIIGISKDTLKEFIGNKRFRSKTCGILYYGVDLKPFSAQYDKQPLFDELNIPETSKLLLFVGRMNVLKNPIFIIDILEVLCSKRKDVVAVFIGKGEQEELVRQGAEEKGLSANIRMPGWRDDIAAIMKMSDVFIFPRVEYPKEGLGLVVVEAQAAGLPMVLSFGIVEDAIEIPGLAHFISLADNPVEWAATVNDLLDQPPAISRDTAYQTMNGSRFGMLNATKNLIALYES